MTRYWVLVADATRARIFAREKKFGPLEELNTMVHPESRLQRQSLVSDRPGQVQESAGAGESANEEPTDPKLTESIEFARDVSQQITQGRTDNAFEGLILVAEPKFLGLLRKHLDAHTEKVVKHEIPKNMTREDTKSIARLLDEHL